MGSEGRPIKIGERWPVEEPEISELLDPVALEERLKEARIRRAAALANRKTAAPPPRPEFAEAPTAFRGLEAADAPVDEEFVEPTPSEPTLRQAQAPETRVPPAAQPPLAAAPVTVAPAAEAGTQRGRLIAVPAWAIFAAGLAFGGAIVAIVALAPRAPETSPPQITAAAPPAAAPEPAPATPAAEPETAVSTPAPAAAPAPAPEAPAATAPEAPAPVTGLAALPLAADADAPAPEPAPPPDLAAPAVDPTAVPEPALETASLAPEPAPAPAAEPAAPIPADAAAEAPPAPALVLTPPVAGPLPGRVLIHYPASAGDVARSAEQALRAAGIENVAIVPVSFAISRSNIRFYHDSDAASAGTVADILGDGGDAPVTRDFTDYATPAASGTLEVWLSGAPSAAGPRRSSTPATEPMSSPRTAARTVVPTLTPEPLEPAPSTVEPLAPPPTADQAQAVARIIVERAYERLLSNMPAN